MKKHRVVIAAGCVLLVVLIVVVIIFIKSSKKKDVPQTVTMQTKELQKRTIMNTLSITGTVESATSKTVTFAMTDAEVETINVKIGDYVKKGDIICVFDSSDLEEDLADARTNLNVGQAKTANELESAEEALENTKTSSEISQTRAAQSTAEASGTYSEAQQKADDAYAAYETAEKKLPA